MGAHCRDWPSPNSVIEQPGCVLPGFDLPPSDFNYDPLAPSQKLKAPRLSPQLPRLIVRTSLTTRRLLCGFALLVLADLIGKVVGAVGNLQGCFSANMAVVALGGAAAQLVDGSLGMGYGLTSSTFLVAAGVPPAIASASVHMAELGTTAISGLAHHRFGNVDWHAAVRIAPSGALGAFLGATLLSSLSTEAARPVAAALLLMLGLYVLIKFSFSTRCCDCSSQRPLPAVPMLAALGLVGGFIDATGGGGWGPCCTPALLATGTLTPARAIGVVSASEFAVALAASAGFITSLGTASVHVDIVLTLLAGGVIAAPIAAAMVKWLPARALGITAGLFICATNARALILASR